MKPPFNKASSPAEFDRFVQQILELLDGGNRSPGLTAFGRWRKQKKNQAEVLDWEAKWNQRAALEYRFKLGKIADEQGKVYHEPDLSTYGRPQAEFSHIVFLRELQKFKEIDRILRVCYPASLGEPTGEIAKLIREVEIRRIARAIKVADFAAAKLSDPTFYERLANLIRRMAILRTDEKWKPGEYAKLLCVFLKLIEKLERLPDKAELKDAYARIEGHTEFNRRLRILGLNGLRGRETGKRTAGPVRNKRDSIKSKVKRQR